MQYFDLVKSPLKGINLIEASAGTGKTYIIAGLFLRLILEKGILADKILSVTYTEAATEELRHRIRERLKDALNALNGNEERLNEDELITYIAGRYKNNESALWRLKDALTRFDEASICTIHGFCKRMLSENAFESNSLFNSELLTDQSGLIQEIADDFWRRNFYTASPLIAQYAMKNNINVSGFLKLVRYLSADPSFEIIPDVQKPDISLVETRFLKTYENLRKEWLLNKSAVKDILLTNNGLNQKKYPRNNTARWIDRMEEYLSSENPVMIFDAFGKFTTGSIGDSIKKGFSAPVNKFFDACEDFLKVYDSTMLSLEKFVLFKETELFDFVKSEAVKKKRMLNVITFDDLLVNMHNALKDGNKSALAKAVRSRYKAALIDEFQDSDPVQFGIFKSIFNTPGSTLFLIGDPKQSIYKFRGADIFAYINASKNIKSKYTLGTNWRSTPELIKAVNTIFQNREYPFIFKEIAYNPVNAAGRIKGTESIAPLKIWILNKENNDKKNGIITKQNASAIIVNAVAGEIHRLVSGCGNYKNTYSRTIKPGDIAVLVRKNFQAGLVQRELQRYNIPGVLYGSESIFDSHEAGEMERVLLSVAGPGDERLLKSALATDMLGCSGKDIFDLASEETILENYINRFYEYHAMWENHGFYRMFRQFLEHEGVRGRLLSYTNGERRMTNILHLAEILHNAENGNKLGMETLIGWLDQKISDIDRPDEHEIRLETDDDAVRILTVHRCKGLEFPVVFCPFAWGESAIERDKAFAFHNPANNYNLTLDLARDPANKEIAEAEELAENMRLLYVALTRAKHSAYLFWGRINETETSAPAYIFHYAGNDLSDPVTRLRNNAQFLTYESIMKDVGLLAEKSEEAIHVQNVPKFEYKRIISTDAKPEYINRIFTGKIRNDWGISSFSGLTHDSKEFTESPDHDRIYSMPGTAQKPADNSRSIFSFPKGTFAGSCIHEIFENLDFINFKEENTRKIIKDALLKYNIEDNWQDTLADMVIKVLNTPFLRVQPDFTLRKISENDRLNELEFFYPSGLITPHGLADIFRKYRINIDNEFITSLERLGFIHRKGFVKGYIDMVFQYKEKYYIVDWKSNHLGNEIRDYASEKIDAVMKKNYYILQYYLYTVALHRFLLLRKADYDYGKHFGGIIYVFIRGIDPGYPYYGIYTDIPPKETIESLSEYFLKPTNPAEGVQT